jgi:hypothetical protein
VVNGIVAGQRELRRAIEQHHVALVAPSSRPGVRELWLVVAGRIWARTSIGAEQGEDVVLSVTSRATDAPVEDRVIAEAGRGYDPVDGVDSAGAASRLAASWRRYQAAGMPDVSHDTLDDAHILNRWIASHSDHPALTVLDLERVDEPAYWGEVVGAALRLPDEVLTLDVTGPGAATHQAEPGEDGASAAS